MDYTQISALSDDAIALISPEQNIEDEPDDNGDVELEDIEYGEDYDYDTEPDDDYLDNDDYEDDDYEGDDYFDDEDDDDYIEEIEIEGIGRISIDEILEWRQGNLRQSDYTKKTQELARQREELKDAQEVYDYLKTNPQLLGNLRNGIPQFDETLNEYISPERDMLRQVMYNQKAMEVENKLNNLKQKYGEVDEVALFTKASELNTEDLESVYKIIAYDSNTEQVDKETLKEQLRQELLAELQENRKKVKTTVSTRQKSPNRVSNAVSDAEKRVAEGLGISLSEYAKWRG